MYEHTHVCALWGGFEPVDGVVRCPYSGMASLPGESLECRHCAYWVRRYTPWGEPVVNPEEEEYYALVERALGAVASLLSLLVHGTAALGRSLLRALARPVRG